MNSPVPRRPAETFRENADLAARAFGAMLHPGTSAPARSRSRSPRRNGDESGEKFVVLSGPQKVGKKGKKIPVSNHPRNANIMKHCEYSTTYFGKFIQ